jgi:hypothetical protein
VSGGVPPVLMWPFASARSELGAVRGHSDPSLPPLFVIDSVRQIPLAARFALGHCWPAQNLR